MADFKLVNEAIGGFNAWEQPWTFMPAVLAQEQLDSVARQVIGALWAEVTDAKYWVNPGFDATAALIRRQLGVTYPWLHADAVDALIRGASYTWR